MSESTEKMTQKDYEDAFWGRNKKMFALNQALDTRKFEIELYWKRATYFWTFIAASMAGFLVIQASSVSNKQDLSVILTSLGVVFSVAWFCANKGSKFWQENWEKHVDMLETDVMGPLFKVVLSRNESEDQNDQIIVKKITNYISEVVTGPARISVSKINQVISLYVGVLWFCLLIYSLPEFSTDKNVNVFYVIVVGLSGCACVAFLFLCKTYKGEYYPEASLRKTRIKDE